MRDFLQINELNESELRQARFVIDPSKKPAGDHSRIHNRNLKEVAVLTSEEPKSVDIVVRKRSGGLTSVSDHHRAFDLLHFVLLFPHGTDGWHLNIPQMLVFIGL